MWVAMVNHWEPQSHIGLMYTVQRLRDAERNGGPGVEGEAESESAVHVGIEARVWTVEVWWCQGEISEAELISHGVGTK